jgi:hypothetical protein
LLHRKAPSSYDDLRTVAGKKYKTYKEACLKLGLAYDDSEWDLCLEESAKVSLPSQMRLLFAQILIHCLPIDPLALWEKYKHKLAEDFTNKKIAPERAYQAAYVLIAELINQNAVFGRNFDYFINKYRMPKVDVAVDKFASSTINQTQGEIVFYI